MTKTTETEATSEKQPTEQTILTPETLRTASVEDLLAYGLTLDEKDPALGMIRGVRRDLALVVDMAQRAGGYEDEFCDLLSVLETFCRRLDVGIELLDRRQREPPLEPSAAPESA